MKFINKSTGVILEPKSDMVIEQLQKSADFTVFEEVQAEQEEKPIGKMNKDELTAYANNAGIQVPEGATKADIIELIKAVAND